MTAELLQMQAPQGVPRSPLFATITDPLVPPQQVSEMLAHLPEEVYDKRPESHLSRLLHILLGDTGTGQLRKRYTYSHLSTFLLTTHYYALDQMYAEVFGVRRFLREQLGIDVYYGSATDEEWEAINAADASYRARIEAFSRSLLMAGTPSGMVMAASALLGDECRVYESYEFLDNESVYANAVASTQNTWGDLEVFTYGDLDGRTYAELEGGHSFQGRMPDSRGEFIIRPLRTVTAEEQYHLTKVLSRIKPVEALMTIDARPVTLHTPLPVTRAVASSNYWHVQSQVQVNPEYADLYDRVEEGVPVQQPRAAFSEYQSESWDHNADVVTVSSYVEDEDGNVEQDGNYERVVDDDGEVHDYTPDLALSDPGELLFGWYVQDGVLTAPVMGGGQ